MLEKLSNYRTALWFAIAIALSNVVTWSAISFLSPYLSQEAVTVCAVYLAIPLGLWVQSNLIRYLGAVWMVVWAGVMMWPLVSSGTAPFTNRPEQAIPLFIFFSFLAGLNLLTAWILLMSKKFAREFSYEREHQQNYKKYLKWLLLTAVIGATLIATLMNIINLASN